MKRRLFTILALTSLLLFVAVARLWVRSLDGAYDDFAYLAPRGKHGFVGYHVGSSDGALTVARIRVRGGERVAADDGGFRHQRGIRASLWSWSFQTEMMMLRHGVQRGRWGAVWARDIAISARGRESINAVMFPHWAALLGLVMLPGAWCRAWLRRRRARIGSGPVNRCGSCGYDLRATPERCPECGAAVPPSVAPATGMKE